MDHSLRDYLIDSQYDQKSFSTIQKYFEDYSEKELRKELLSVGALPFKGSTEFYGLVERNLKVLGYSKTPKIISKMRKEPTLMIRHLALLLLEDPRFNKRSFVVLEEKLKGYSAKNIRRILAYAGGLRFYLKGEEFWGLPQRNLQLLGFENKRQASKVFNKMKEDDSKMPMHLLELLLMHPLYKQRIFATIKKKIGGFSDDELRGMLLHVGGVAFRDKKRTEFWGLKERNEIFFN